MKGVIITRTNVEVYWDELDERIKVVGVDSDGEVYAYHRAPDRIVKFFGETSAEYNYETMLNNKPSMIDRYLGFVQRWEGGAVLYFRPGQTVKEEKLNGRSFETMILDDPAVDVLKEWRKIWDDHLKSFRQFVTDEKANKDSTPTESVVINWRLVKPDHDWVLVFENGDACSMVNEPPWSAHWSSYILRPDLTHYLAEEGVVKVNSNKPYEHKEMVFQRPKLTHEIVLNWDAIDPEYVFFAMDADLSVWGYKSDSLLEFPMFVKCWEADSALKQKLIDDELVLQKPDSEYWQMSFTRRPK